MQYIISDIHGNLGMFKRILKRVAFDDQKDKMLILGDLVDRGPDGIKLIEYIKPYIANDSIKLLMGNHELFAIMYLQGELDARTWISFGGRETLNSINNMGMNERKQLLQFLEGLPYYTEIDSKYFGKAIATHSGIDIDNLVYNVDGSINVKKSIEKALENNRYRYLVGKDLHYMSTGEKKKLDRYLIIGHVPAFTLNEDMSNRFFRTPYYMDIDAGAGHKGGRLGCYCSDTDEEIII